MGPSARCGHAHGCGLSRREAREQSASCCGPKDAVVSVADTPGRDFGSMVKRGERQRTAAATDDPGEEQYAHPLAERYLLQLAAWLRAPV